MTLLGGRVGAFSSGQTAHSPPATDLVSPETVVASQRAGPEARRTPQCCAQAQARALGASMAGVLPGGSKPSGVTPLQWRETEREGAQGCCMLDVHATRLPSGGRLS